MNASIQPPPVIAECHDTSEKIELYENYVIARFKFIYLIYLE